MVKINIENSRIAVIGSTLLTKELILFLEEVNRPLILFGLPENQIKLKVNSTYLKDYCYNKKIKYIENNSWEYFYQTCLKDNIDLIIEFGDSRIIPSTITNNIFTIGNHGAILPFVKGGASLVWGRMANMLHWGVSLMKIEESIDEGEIIITKNFNYESDISMQNFLNISDKKTIDCFKEIIGKDLHFKKNVKNKIVIANHTDSYDVVLEIKNAIKNSYSIYLPPRTPEDGKINKKWPKDFIEIFKIANNIPYPKYFY
tara:strand:- start:1158 stop:1931 length:774 start_codon:yes stop_codon:yes gene_type:complete